MPFSHLPPLLTSTFSCLAYWLHKRSALRLPRLLLGVLFATRLRTVTSWFRAAAITDDFRPAYTTVCALGRHIAHMGILSLRHLGRVGGVNSRKSGTRLVDLASLRIADTPSFVSAEVDGKTRFKINTTEP